MNANLIKHEFHWNGKEDDFDENSTISNGELVLYFSNGIILETCVFHDRCNGIFLRSPYVDGEMYFTLYREYPSKRLATFEITKSYSNIFKNEQFIKKFTKLNYWLFIKARHKDRKKVKKVLATL